MERENSRFVPNVSLRQSTREQSIEVKLRARKTKAIKNNTKTLYQQTIRRNTRHISNIEFSSPKKNLQEDKHANYKSQSSPKRKTSNKNILVLRHKFARKLKETSAEAEWRQSKQAKFRVYIDFFQIIRNRRKLLNKPEQCETEYWELDQSPTAELTRGSAATFSVLWIRMRQTRECKFREIFSQNGRNWNWKLIHNSNGRRKREMENDDGGNWQEFIGC